MNKFECDRAKARSNQGKHGIKFTDAARAFNTAPSLTRRSPLPSERTEERNITITKLANGLAVVVVWTPRQGNVRIISVRHARRKEREALNAYLEQLQ